MGNVGVFRGILENKRAAIRAYRPVGVLDVEGGVLTNPLFDHFVAEVEGGVIDYEELCWFGGFGLVEESSVFAIVD